MNKRWFWATLGVFFLAMEALMIGMAWTRSEESWTHEFPHNTWGLTLGVLIITAGLGGFLYYESYGGCPEKKCELRKNHKGLHAATTTNYEVWN